MVGGQNEKLNNKTIRKRNKDNLFQLNKHELIIIIRHIQSMINKHYMGEEVL